MGTNVTGNTNPFAEPDPSDQHLADKLPKDQPETEDELVDEWGEESFPGSDPPANY
ncbi:hypothetical protein [Corynebacterium pacaense]|uniref:hypothetical protein n=1 Tax=Corynebacterium pacaense TaxID=1816684 RepID=UPI0015C4AEF4|nr:hypothetical protein [Corynebacterium pacaense]